MNATQEAAAILASQPQPAPLTKEQAAAPYLRLHYTGRHACGWEVGPRGGETYRITQARANGKLKTWKREPGRWSLPVKAGLREYSYATNTDAAHWHREEDCPALKAAEEWRRLTIFRHTLAALADEIERRTHDKDLTARLIANAGVRRVVEAGQADTQEQLEHFAQRLIETNQERARKLAGEARAEAGQEWSDIRATTDADNYADWEAGRR